MRWNGAHNTTQHSTKERRILSKDSDFFIIVQREEAIELELELDHSKRDLFRRRFDMHSLSLSSSAILDMPKHR